MNDLLENIYGSMAQQYGFENCKKYEELDLILITDHNGIQHKVWVEIKK